jgi:glycerol-3-phosphate acyltransferase PlsX
MGSAFCRAVFHLENPQVGLLNIGEEARKGTAAARQAYLALETTPHFVGNVEGREVFQGRVDVLVTDGFTGNIFLKTSEGVCSFLLEQAGPAVRQEMARWERYVREPAGAMLIGLNHLVMKCHGASSPASVTATLRIAFEWLRQGILPAIAESLR